jgi:hypothetical protein
MARQIDINLNAETRGFEQGMKSSADAVDRLDKHLDAAEGGTKKFDAALDKTSDGLEGATGKFRSTADLAGGLGDVLGIQAAGPIAGDAMGFADIADGLGGLLAPALQKAKGAFIAMNATLMANPIFLVIAAIAALGIAFVIAYKKSETFRKIVNAVFGAVKHGAGEFVEFIEDAVTKAAKVIARVADIITFPYKVAFKAIASAWNATLGGFHIGIPGFMGFGGFDFTIPNLPIPALAKGGPINGPALVGEQGPELFMPNSAGTIIPNHALGGTNVTIVIETGASDLDELIRKRVRVLGNGNVQTAFGRR